MLVKLFFLEISQCLGYNGRLNLIFSITTNYEARTYLFNIASHTATGQLQRKGEGQDEELTTEIK